MNRNQQDFTTSVWGYLHRSHHFQSKIILVVLSSDSRIDDMNLALNRQLGSSPVSPDTIGNSSQRGILVSVQPCCLTRVIRSGMRVLATYGQREDPSSCPDPSLTMCVALDRYGSQALGWLIGSVGSPSLVRLNAARTSNRIPTYAPGRLTPWICCLVYPHSSASPAP